MSIRDLLLRAVHDHASASGAEWLDAAVQRAHDGSRDALLEAYTAASARLGTAPFVLDTAAAPAGVASVRFDVWSLEDAGRLALLLTRAERRDDKEFVADACACYEQGDAREQRSWLRGLPLTPDPEAFRALAIDACRTNILPLFESIACENTYPARYFPERNFNQVVLKAMFNNVSLARIVGLAERANPDLARMAADYAAERRAAGRSVPGDIGLAMREVEGGGGNGFTRRHGATEV